MKLTNLEIKEINKKYYTEEYNSTSDNDTVRGISVKTFDIINDFLLEIKLSNKVTDFKDYKQNPTKRFEAYSNSYDKYYNMVRVEDRLIFSKLVNYITAENEIKFADNNEHTFNYRDYLYSHSSNLPLIVNYKASYKGAIINGLFEEKSYIESDLIYNLEKYLLRSFIANADRLNWSERSKIIDEIKIEAYPCYNIDFNTSDLFKLEKTTSKILDSQHFKEWEFVGLRDVDELNLLSFIFSAKNEVISHKGCGATVLNNINVDTCRYASHLIHAIKCNNLNNISNVEEKYNIYNKLYPYIYRQIIPQDRDFFAKLVNYLSFENENYSMHGYDVTGENGTCSYSLYSKAETIERHELFNKIRHICDNRKPSKDIGYFGNYSSFCHSFLGGSAVSENNDFKERRIKALKDIMSNDLFINWKFSGLKTDEEKEFELPSNIDTLKPYGFSENSFFVLSYFINHLCRIGSQEDRDIEKDKLLNKVLKLIPINEVALFNKILNYFTDGFADSLNASPKFVNIIALIDTPDNTFWHTFENVSSLSDITMDEMIQVIKHNTSACCKKDLQEALDVMSEDDLHEYIHIKSHYFEINILPHRFSYFPKYKAKHIYNADLENSREYSSLIFEDILNAINNKYKESKVVRNVKSKISSDAEAEISTTSDILNVTTDIKTETPVEITDNSQKDSSNNLLELEKESPKYDDYNLFDFLLESNKDNDVNKSDDVKEDNLISIKNNESQIDTMFNFGEDGQLSFAI